MKKLITTLGIALLSTQALAVEGVYINEAALELEEQYVNIADILATEYLEHGACNGLEAYQDSIVDAVKKSRQYHDNNYEYNLATEDLFSLTPNTLEAIKTTFALKEVMNMLEPGDAASYENALNRVVMWGPAPGAYGHIRKLVFGENLKVTFYSKELLDEAPWVKWNETPGDFYVSFEGQKKIINLGGPDSNGYDRFELYFDWQYKEWMMKPLDLDNANPFFDGYTDFPDECSA